MANLVVLYRGIEFLEFTEFFYRGFLGELSPRNVWLCCVQYAAKPLYGKIAFFFRFIGSSFMPTTPLNTESKLWPGCNEIPLITKLSSRGLRYSEVLLQLNVLTEIALDICHLTIEALAEMLSVGRRSKLWGKRLSASLVGFWQMRYLVVTAFAYSKKRGALKM